MNITYYWKVLFSAFIFSYNKNNQFSFSRAPPKEFLEPQDTQGARKLPNPGNPGSPGANVKSKGKSAGGTAGGGEGAGYRPHPLAGAGFYEIL